MMTSPNGITAAANTAMLNTATLNNQSMASALPQNADMMRLHDHHVFSHIFAFLDPSDVDGAKSVLAFAQGSKSCMRIAEDTQRLPAVDVNSLTATPLEADQPRPAFSVLREAQICAARTRVNKRNDGAPRSQVGHMTITSPHGKFYRYSEKFPVQASPIESVQIRSLKEYDHQSLEWVMSREHCDIGFIIDQDYTPRTGGQAMRDLHRNTLSALAEAFPAGQQGAAMPFTGWTNRHYIDVLDPSQPELGKIALRVPLNNLNTGQLRELRQHFSRLAQLGILPAEHIARIDKGMRLVRRDQLTAS